MSTEATKISYAAICMLRDLALSLKKRIVIEDIDLLEILAHPEGINQSYDGKDITAIDTVDRTVTFDGRK